MSIVYLDIAGFLIKLSLTKTDGFIYAEKEFLRRINQYYSKFIALKSKRKADFEIEVVYQTSMPAFTSGDKKDFYIGLYTQVSDVKIRTFYSISDEQLYLIIRTCLDQLLAKNNGFFMHGSASKINNKANIFLGVSGAGKSTLITLLAKEFTPIADDSFIIKKGKSNFYFYSTPIWEKNAWFQKGREQLEIRNVFFLKKSENQKITLVSKEKVIEYMFKQLFSSSNAIAAQSQTLMQLINRINNFFILEFGLQKQGELIQILKEANEE